jgi:catechol 2,3-dioxygenase
MSVYASIDPGTSIGAVRLAVADLDGLRGFYNQAIGLVELDDSDGVVRMGAGDPSAEALIELVSEPDAPPRPRHTTGLYHLAILVPGRADLAAALQRVANAGWRLTGASDHSVSEALYLSDPEGNGIEIYRDRPRDGWPIGDGGIRMTTEFLDLDGVLSELRRQDAETGMPAATRIGHVHLNVGDLTEAEAFYSGALGFDVTVRGYPGALFVSAGGYHHHIGLNTWTSDGAPPPPPGARGLRHFEIRLPGEAQLSAEEDRLRESGFEPTRDGGLVAIADPSGNRVVLTAAG